jgi:hypothetical protein
MRRGTCSKEREKNSGAAASKIYFFRAQDAVWLAGNSSVAQKNNVDAPTGKLFPKPIPAAQQFAKEELYPPGANRYFFLPRRGDRATATAGSNRPL